jgi:hypothetical protein
LKYYTRGSEIKLTGRYKHSPLLDTRTLDLREERKANSRCREVGNRIVHKSEGINRCRPKQTKARRLSSCYLQRYFEGNFLFMINISLLPGDMGARGRIIFKCILGKQGLKMWTGFVYRGTGASGGLQ